MTAPQRTSEDGMAVEIPESAAHQDLDPMLFGWRQIAALAWQGFSDQGRGVVHVAVSGAGVEIAYRTVTAVPHPCLPVEGYDPEAQVIVVVERDDDVNVYVVDGWPPPPVMHAFATAEDFGATLQ